MEKSIIIIGGGLTGLSAGCYGQMNGYHTSIFEMHDKVGGVCTGWKRKGYTIDGAMNWLIGTKPGTSYYKLWEELGAAQKWQVFNHDNYIVIENENGKVFTIPCDAHQLEQMMNEIAPEDEPAIREYCKAIRDCGKFEMPVDKPQELYSLIDNIKAIKMLPLLMFMKKWGNISMADFAGRFKNSFLRKIFGMSNEDAYAVMPAFTMPMLFSWMQQREAGYVIGGALALVGYIEKRYLDLGGDLHLKARVDKILVENNKAVGIKLSDGTEHRGDIIISAADGRTTIFDMLDGKYIDKEIQGYYENLGLFSPLVYIGLGVDRKFDDIPAALNGLSFPLETPVSLAGKQQKLLNVFIYNFDPTLAPKDKTLVVIQFDTDYDFWEKLHEDPVQYKAEKTKIADTVVALLDKRFPGLAVQVEMRDVATPMTWVRYTGNWKGSYEGWMITTKSFMMQMSKTLPGLDNFYLAGQWVNPGGGMPTAALSGNHTIQLICKKDKKKFITATP